jgi:hypothetical protein
VLGPRQHTSHGVVVGPDQIPDDRLSIDGPGEEYRIR